MDPVTLDRLAIASTRLRVAGLREGDLSRPTVNAGWDVRALVAHLVGGCLLYAGVLRGGTVEWATRDTRPVTDPLGQFDAAAAIAIHATDMLVHGWDLAVATGQDRGLDPDLCAAATAIISRFPASTWGNPKYYAQRVPTDSTGPADRLVALTGRDPNAGR